MNITIRRVYLYLTSLIGLILVLIGTTQLVNLALKTWVFTKADDNFYAGCPIPAVVPNSTSTKETLDRAYENCDKNEYAAEQRSARRQNDASNSIAFIIVGAPVWLYHWKKVKNEQDV